MTVEPLPERAGVGDLTVVDRPLADGCPEACGNVEEPYETRNVRWRGEDVAVRAAYHCTDCGAVWFTEWKDD